MRARWMAAAVVGVALLSACTSTVVGRATPPLVAPRSTPAAESGPVTLTVTEQEGVETLGKAGLLAEYRRSRPQVTIREVVVPAAAYLPKISTELAAGRASDIYVLPGSFLGTVHRSPDAWADLSGADLGGDQAGADFYPAAVQPATVGGKLLALPAGTAPTAMCFRPQLMAAAGLPADREQLAGRWSSWPAYLAVGRQYVARTGKPWVDSAGALFRAVLGGSPEQFFDTEDRPVYATNPRVKQAFDLVAQAAAQRLLPPVSQFSPEWFTAVRSGQSATMPCAPWMLGLIKAQQGSGWDVARPPGPSSFGGSYWGVPAAGSHKKAAYDFLAWLLAPQRQAAAYAGDKGDFPAGPAAGADPTVTGKTDAAFAGAPVGRIYAAIAAAMPPVAPGAGRGDPDSIHQIYANHLVQVATGTERPDAAWTKATTEVRNLVGS